MPYHEEGVLEHFTETYLGPCKTSMMKLFTKTVKFWKPLITFVKSSIIVVQANTCSKSRIKALDWQWLDKMKDTTAMSLDVVLPSKHLPVQIH